MRMTLRRARRTHLCDSCRRTVEVGDRYLEFVYSPDHDDVGNTRWARYAECRGCATDCGRDHHFEPKGTVHNGR